MTKRACKTDTTYRSTAAMSAEAHAYCATNKAKSRLRSGGCVRARLQLNEGCITQCSCTACKCCVVVHLRRALRVVGVLRQEQCVHRAVRDGAAVNCTSSLHQDISVLCEHCAAALGVLRISDLLPCYLQLCKYARRNRTHQHLYREKARTSRGLSRRQTHHTAAGTGHCTALASCPGCCPRFAPAARTREDVRGHTRMCSTSQQNEVGNSADSCDDIEQDGSLKARWHVLCLPRGCRWWCCVSTAPKLKLSKRSVSGCMHMHVAQVTSKVGVWANFSAPWRNMGRRGDLHVQHVQVC
jgi:hypothetical protein